MRLGVQLAAASRRGDLPVDCLQPSLAPGQPGLLSLRAFSTSWQLVATGAYFTMVESLKIGRMIAIAMKPTTPPISMIMMGSIMDVTVLMVSRRRLA